VFLSRVRNKDKHFM